MSIFDRIFFTQARKLINLAKQNGITENDHIALPSHISAYTTNWNQQVIDWSSNRGLYFSLIKASKSFFWICVFLQILASLCSFSTPFFIHQFMTLLQNLNEGKLVWTDQNLYKLIGIAIGLGLSGAGHGLIIQHYFYRNINFFQISSNLLNKKIYNHALKISNTSKQEKQIGEIVNLMSSDAEAVGDLSMVSIDLFNSVLLLVGCSAMLFYYMGWSALVAIIVMAGLIPLTQQLAKKFTVLEEEQMKYRDQRISIMAQVLNAIRVVKYFNWEKSVISEISNVRNDEIQSRLKLYKAENLWGLMYVSISTVVLFCALYTHYLRGFKIDLALVLTCISIFAVMEDQFGGLSKFISRFINIFVSGKRITDFLKTESVDQLIKNQDNVNQSIDFKKVEFAYSQNQSLFNNINFTINKHESIAIIGAVASGKTTILDMILKEYAAKSGEINIPNEWKIAYQSQEPFILNATLRENIIFGAKNISPILLEKAIELSALRQDIQNFQSGLDTEIGEKGVNLSGGQRHRVCLARCFLANADLILLDDPLSAVDVNTENQICEKLIFGEWDSKTRIVVTHRLSHLDKFDRIFFVNKGEIKVGKFDELLAESKEFKSFVRTEIENKKSEQLLDLSKKSEVSVVAQTDNHRITVDEDRVIGAVDKSIYTSYISSLGGQGRYKKWILISLLLSALISVFAPLVQKGWLTQNNINIDVKVLILVYGMIGLFMMVIFYYNNFFWMWRGIKSGIHFHDATLKSLLKTDVRFFDSTPTGRILQRFSRDVESVDIHIQWTFEQTLSAMLQVLTSFLLIVITLPLTLIFLGPIIFYYYILQNKYRLTAREVKRLDSLARSPRYSHFKETLQGLSVIRAFKKEDYFKDDFLIKLQKSTQAFYNHVIVNRWFSTRLPLVGATISLITLLAIIYSSQQRWISAGVAGLVTLYALQLWRYLNWGIRIFSDLESRMTSVERLNFYQELEQEKSFSTEVPELLPKTGSLEFKNIYLRYAEHLPLVLNGVSFKIQSGKKIGIIGRTGSGKSTLFQAVYRFVHFESGDILLDGHSIRDYPLDQLRKSLSVIPQDPSLFMGTLRSNLDRYTEKTDEEIFHVLEKVGLINFIQKLPDQLNHLVTENGSNLSQGQRQLICLARALLMKVKIIFLDEATASVDIETDAFIQQVIRTSLYGITLVTIAHRLSTLKGYDQIIELNQGRVV